MATPATTQDIADGSKCVYQCVPPGMQMAALIYIFNQIRILGGGTAMTAQEIVDAAKCYVCIPRGMEFAALIYLANAFVAGGGGGSVTPPGVVNPEGVVTAAAGSTYYNTANSTFWEKTAGAGNTGWIQLI